MTEDNTNYTHYPILIVDDDEPILELMKEMLSMTFEVKTTSDPERYHELIGDYDFAVVLVDYHLGSINGLKLVNNTLVGEISPQFIIISGDQSTKILHDAVNDDQISGFLKKPFNQKQLINLVKEHYQAYLKSRDAVKETSRAKQDAQLYRNQVKAVNSSLYDTLISSHSNYQMANRIAEIINDQLNYLKTHTTDTNDSKVINSHIIDTRNMISSFRNQFDIDRLLVIDALLETLLLLDEQPKDQCIQNLEDYMKSPGMSNLLQESTQIKQQVDDIIEELERQLKSDNFSRVNVLNSLANLNIGDLISPEYMLKYELPQPSIELLLIINEDKPVFRYSNTSSKITELSLVTNFFVALDAFSDEMMDHGKLNTIQFDQGVIMVRRQEDITFLCLVDYETMAVRLSFQAFAMQTINYILDQKSTTSLDDDEFLHDHLEELIDYDSDAILNQ